MLWTVKETEGSKVLTKQGVDLIKVVKIRFNGGLFRTKQYIFGLHTKWGHILPNWATMKFTTKTLHVGII
jgi:hypothetical protein